MVEKAGALIHDAASSKNIRIAFCLVTALFFLWGLSYGLLDVMNKNFQNQHLNAQKKQLRIEKLISE